jgi:hypothetical protein
VVTVAGFVDVVVVVVVVILFLKLVG